ncbi:hypothetical protein, partial [Methanosarcina mazei]|uniref:hypothetical protein n=1 Tax=Methanosarcina mazei TaxID=2209 RepID=UPI00064F099F
MSNKSYFVVENLKLDALRCSINDYILLKQHPSKPATIFFVENVGNEESNCVLFFNALRLALPKINIHVIDPYINACLLEGADNFYSILLKDFNTILFNYWGAKGEYDFNSALDYIDTIVLTNKELDHIKKIFALIIEQNKLSRELRKTNEFMATRWVYAYNQ